MYVYNYTGAPCNFSLILLRPNGRSKVQITHKFGTQVIEANTGIESRAPEQEVQRHSIKYSLLLDAAKATELRTLLRSLAGARVGVPLWPDLFPTADYAANKIYSSQVWANINFATGGVSVNLAVGLPDTVGILIGRIKGEPTFQAITDTISQLELQVEEDSPWEARIEPNTLAMSTWTLRPNWTTRPQEMIRNPVTVEQIGAGRENAISGQEGEEKRLQEAVFQLNTRTDIRKLLTFFADKRGSLKSFALPVWYNPAAPGETFTARFYEDGLTLDYTWREPATARIRFIEELALVPGVPSQERPGRAWLYKLQYEGAAAQYYTNYEKSLTYAGNTYTPQKIEHKGFVQTLKIKGDEVEITSDNFTGNPFSPYVKLELERKLALEIYECDPATPATAVMIFAGEVRTARAEGRKLKAIASTFGGKLASKLPRFYCQTRCNYTVGDALCGVNMATHKVTGTLGAQSGTQVDVTCGSVAAADYFAYGWALFGSGATAEKRAIVRSTPIGGGQRLIIHRPLKQTGAIAVEFYPGCDGQFEGGCVKFSNQAAFGGFPYQPAFIDSVATGFKPKIGK
jgi:hypothetical protein